jgi:VanZ family protein
MAIIFLASAMPGSELPEFGNWDTLAKKAGHMLGYALLAAAYLHALNRGRGISGSRLIASVCLAILYAVLDEWHQGFVPGRNPSVWDVVIDGAGSVVGLAARLAVRRHLPVASKPADV